ncbi:MAG TPA: hypothetical protein PLP70_00600 [bacterium]|jgi:hypothetical protein|nr:hypothetical protein [bacterium]HOR69382.1 hypothetical protein [bacterium]HOS99195.1 hypothetical protein [bacterium]HPD03428.1 hypothetical protein [bacterium]HPL83547.1 hypothetical protein [bacterium]
MHLSPRLIYKGILIASVMTMVITVTPRLVRAAEFNPNLIISDAELLDAGTMSLADIQQFLESHGSYLANYRGEDYYGTVRSAAEIIYNAATNSYDCSGVAVDNPQDFEEAKAKCVRASINPRFLLVLLQKEQSLIEDPSPKASQLDWAMGYGCPDGAACSERWRGFGKQVNAAALQFYDYMINPRYYHYQVGQSYTMFNTNHDPVVVTPANRATAALYNYTPHVYNGNYNFWKLWQRYFTQIYPDGSLLQPEGEEVVYLIQSGHKRPFTSHGALVSRFDPRKIITVKPADLENYPLGAPIKFQQYSLVQAPSGAIYLIVDDKRRGFVSKQAFSKMGFNMQEVVKASWEDLAPYKESTPITVTSTYPTGALLQDKKTGGVYWVEEGFKYPLVDRVLLTTKFANRRIIPADATELAAYQTGAPVKLDDGNLIKIEDSPNVYILDHGEKRLIPSEQLFNGLGYKWSNIITVNPQHFELYLLGQPVEDRLSVDSGPPVATSTPATSLSDLVSTSTTNDDLSSTSSSTINSLSP